MASPKARSPKADPSSPGGSKVPLQGNLPLTPLSDFDHEAFLNVCVETDARIKGLQKSLASVMSGCDETRKVGALPALGAGETAPRLGTHLADARAELQQCLAVLERLQEGLEHWKAAEPRSRKIRFEHMANSMQWKITGRWPEPVIGGIVFVVVDERKDRATVNGRAVAPPTAERLAMQVARELEELSRQRTEPEEFIAGLWRAYRTCGGTPGNGVLVQDLLTTLTWQRQSRTFQRDPRQELFRGYSQAQFRADLTQYLGTGAPPVLDGGKAYDLEVVGGSFAQEGIYMYFPQSDRLATCGRLTFKQADQEAAP